MAVLGVWNDYECDMNMNRGLFYFYLFLRLVLSSLPWIYIADIVCPSLYRVKEHQYPNTTSRTAAILNSPSC